MRKITDLSQTLEDNEDEDFISIVGAKEKEKVLTKGDEFMSKLVSIWTGLYEELITKTSNEYFEEIEGKNFTTNDSYPLVTNLPKVKDGFLSRKSFGSTYDWRIFEDGSLARFKDIVVKEAKAFMLKGKYGEETSFTLLSIVNKTMEFRIAVKFKLYSESYKQEEYRYATGVTVYQELLVQTLLKDYKFMEPINKEAGFERVVSHIMDQFWEMESLSIFFSFSSPIIYNPSATGTVKLGNGSLFYLPKVGTEVDKRKDYVSALLKGTVPARLFVALDSKNEVLVQTNTSGEIDYFSLSGYLPLTDEDINFEFEKPISNVVTHGPSSLYSIAKPFSGYVGTDIQYVKENLDRERKEQQSLAERGEKGASDRSLKYIKDLEIELSETELNETLNTNRRNSLKTFYLADPKKAINIFLQLKEAYVTKKDSILPSSYLSAMGILQNILENLPKCEAIQKKVEDKRTSFNTVTKEDAPEIPNLLKGLFFFPHQAEGLAKVNVAGETAIFDVGTGGGKTLLIIADALNLMKKGEVKRPLVVMPDNLVGQFLGQINFFTGGTVNPIVLSTTTINNWGLDKIEELIATAPPNSIFITTYPFLRNGGEEDELGGKQYPNVEWIKDHVKPDYINLDESHNIKTIGRATNESCMQLRSAKYRRISSGTVVSNTPSDLVGQVSFLNPRILGDSREFQERYCIGGYNGRSSSLGWKSNAADLIREDLAKNTFHLSYWEKDWAACLPEIKYNKWVIDMSPSHKKIYKMLVDQVMEEIMEDPILAAKWAEFCQASENSDDLISMSGKLLGKFAKLEQYLTAPDRSNFTQFALTGPDLVSPKMEKIDELIGESIKAGYKTIVAVHFKFSAMHLWLNSKYKEQGVYYDASHKDVVRKFEADSDCKVLFAVVQSIKEGFNLQFADRVIVADVDWTSGNLKQLVARVFRPNVEIKDGKMHNKNKGKTVYIDYVLCNDSADVLKYCYQTYKKLFNSSVMYASPVNYPSPPSINEGALTSTWQEMHGDEFLASDNEYYEWIGIEIATMKAAGNDDPLPVKHTKSIGKEKVKVPWVVGMPLPKDKDGESLFEWLKDQNLDDSDLTVHRDLLVNKVVLTEYGEGKIVGCSKRKVKVKDAEGNSYSVDFNTVIILDKVEFELEMAEDDSIELMFYLYDGKPTLIVGLDDPDAVKLKAIGFTYQGPYWYRELTSKKFAQTLLTKIQRKYTIPSTNLNEIGVMLKDITGRVRYSFSSKDIRTFQKIVHKQASADTIKLYPMIESGTYYLVADKKTNPSLSEFRFELADGMWYHFAVTKQNIKDLITKVEKVLKLTISNKEDFKAQAKEFGFKF